MKRGIFLSGLFGLCSTFAFAHGFGTTYSDPNHAEYLMYKGQVQLIGRYVQAQGDASENGSNRICFYPNNTDHMQVPREHGDQRLQWFCFSNADKARQLLKLPTTIAQSSCSYQGTATVTVGEYGVYLPENDQGNDIAKLIAVKRHTPAKAVGCE